MFRALNLLMKLPLSIGFFELPCLLYHYNIMNKTDPGEVKQATEKNESEHNNIE